MPARERWPAGHGSVTPELPRDKHAIKPIVPAWGSGAQAKEKPLFDDRGTILPPEKAIPPSGWIDCTKHNSGASSSSTGDFNRVPEYPKRPWNEQQREREREQWLGQLVE